MINKDRKVQTKGPQIMAAKTRGKRTELEDNTHVTAPEAASFFFPVLPEFQASQ